MEGGRGGRLGVLGVVSSFSSLGIEECCLLGEDMDENRGRSCPQSQKQKKKGEDQLHRCHRTVSSRYVCV